MKKKIVVISGGGHSKVLISILRKMPSYIILGYIDPRDNGKILGVPRLGDDSCLKRILHSNPGCSAVVGMGILGVSPGRIALLRKLRKLGFELPCIVSPDSIVNEDVSIGEGSVVFDGVVVNAGSRIGTAAILNTNCTVEHDCIIGDNSHIAPGATLSGGVSVGKNCLVGTGASVIQGRKICDNCIVAAGAALIRDCKVPGMYAGNPASLRKKL